MDVVVPVGDALTDLVFPLIVVLLGSLLAALTPGWTRRRDDHRRALEVKTQLVSEMSQAVTEMVTAIRFAADPQVSQTPDEYEDAYKAWQKRRAALGTKLEAYFPEKPKRNIKKDWREFVECMSDFYEIIRDRRPTADRANKLLKKAVDLREELRANRPRQDSVDAGRKICRIDAGESLKQAEEKLEEVIFACKGELIDSVMSWRVDGLEEPPIKDRLVNRTRSVGRWLKRTASMNRG